MNKKNCEENHAMDRQENKRTAIQSVLETLNRAKSYKWGHTTYLRIPIGLYVKVSEALNEAFDEDDQEFLSLYGMWNGLFYFFFFSTTMNKLTYISEEAKDVIVTHAELCLKNREG